MTYIAKIALLIPISVYNVILYTGFKIIVVYCVGVIIVNVRIVRIMLQFVQNVWLAMVLMPPEGAAHVSILYVNCVVLGLIYAPNVLIPMGLMAVVIVFIAQLSTALIVLVISVDVSNVQMGLDLMLLMHVLLVLILYVCTVSQIVQYVQVVLQLMDGTH